MGGEAGDSPAGWYPDPSGQFRLRFWSHEEGWSGTAVSGPLDADPQAEPARAGGLRRSRGLLIGVGVVLLCLAGFLGVLASRADWPVWLIGPPLPPAPPLPPGIQVVEVIESSDADAGWLGIRGSAFTSGWSADEMREFYGQRFTASEGWREVAPAGGQATESARDFCWARITNEEGDWESVLLNTSSTPGRFVVMRSEMSDGFWPVPVGESPTMEGCTNARTWTPSSVFNWLDGVE